MTDDQQRDLNILRTAINQREWTTSQDVLKRLLTNLEPLIALGIATPLLQDFLPIFEATYPEARWVRELLLTVIVYGSAPGDLPLQALSEFTSPGCGHFLLAVFDSARAVHSIYTVFERYSHITNAIVNAILAHLQHNYYEFRPDSFARLRDPQTSETIRTQLQANFWMDKQVAARDQALWFETAERIETVLQQ